MVLHGRNNCRFGKFQIFFIEGTAQGCRILDEVNHLFQKVFVHNDGAAFLYRQIRQALQNKLFSFCRVDDEKMLPRSRFIAGGFSDFKVAAAEEAVTAADTTGFYVRNFKGDDVRPVKGCDPTNRTGEAHRLVTPEHALRKG